MNTEQTLFFQQFDHGDASSFPEGHPTRCTLSRNFILAIAVNLFGSSVSFCSMFIFMVNDICSKHSSHVKRQDRLDGHLPQAPETDHKAAHEIGHGNMSKALVCLNSNFQLDFVEVLTFQYLLSGIIVMLIFFYLCALKPNSSNMGVSLRKFFLLKPLLIVALIIAFQTHHEFRILTFLIISLLAILEPKWIEVMVGTIDFQEIMPENKELFENSFFVKRVISGLGYFVGLVICFAFQSHNVFPVYLSLAFSIFGAIASLKEVSENANASDNLESDEPTLSEVTRRSQSENNAIVNKSKLVTSREALWKILWGIAALSLNHSISILLITLGVTKYNWRTIQLGLGFTLSETASVLINPASESRIFTEESSRSSTFRVLIIAASSCPSMSLALCLLSLALALTINSSSIIYFSLVVLSLSRSASHESEIMNAAISFDVQNEFLGACILSSWMIPLGILQTYSSSEKYIAFLLLITPCGLLILLEFVSSKLTMPFPKDSFSAISLEELPAQRAPSPPIF